MAVLTREEYRRHITGWTVYYLFELTRRDFVQRSEGNAGRFTKKWKPHSPSTKAYRQLRRGESRRYGVRRYSQGKGILTPKLTKLWRGIYAKAIQRGKDPSEAAKLAWGIVKKKGGKTLLETLSNRELPINIHTGALLASLSPGVVTASGEYIPRPNQVVDVRGTTIKIDISLPYFQFVNAIRPIWPENTNRLVRAAEGLAKQKVKQIHEVRTHRGSRSVKSNNHRFRYRAAN